jgi:hypothetical protein
MKIQETRTVNKQKRNGRLMIIASLAGAIVIGGTWGYGKYADVDHVEAKATPAIQKQIDATNYNDQKVPSVKGSDFDINGNYSDQEITRIIHLMSHQKIVSVDGEKWGGIVITKERINSLLTIIDKNRDVLEDYDTYRSIVERWKDGNFSHAVEDHNDMWNFEQGTVGKASRLATPGEEKSYSGKLSMSSTYDAE